MELLDGYFVLFRAAWMHSTEWPEIAERMEGNGEGHTPAPV